MRPRPQWRLRSVTRAPWKPTRAPITIRAPCWAPVRSGTKALPLRVADRRDPQAGPVSAPIREAAAGVAHPLLAHLAAAQRQRLHRSQAPAARTGPNLPSPQRHRLHPPVVGEVTFKLGGIDAQRHAQRLGRGNVRVGARDTADWRRTEHAIADHGMKA
jgi:hypothetical protein